MEKRFYDLNSYFKKQFGHRVHKIAIDSGLTCPNRDGTLSDKGCIYCNAKGSGTGANDKGLSITEQLESAKAYVTKRFKAKKFVAYFQSYTNTYAPVSKLAKMYEEALSVKDVAGLAIGTRPDCVDEAVLKLLEEYARTNLIWIEYGLQSASDKTLDFINRGHDFNCFVRAVEKTKNRGIYICTHIILGLPGEDKKDMLATARAISGLGIDGIKFHLLYVIKDTPLDKLYLQGKYKCLSQDEYIAILCDFLEILPEKIVIQRLTSDPHPYELRAPLWSIRKKEIIEAIMQRLEKNEMRQGRLYKRACSKSKNYR